MVVIKLEKNLIYFLQLVYKTFIKIYIFYLQKTIVYQNWQASFFLIVSWTYIHVPNIGYRLISCFLQTLQKICTK